MACDDSSGDGNGCEEGSRRARPRPSRSAITIRMRALVRLLRAQIRLLEQALGEKTDMHPSAFEHLVSLRLTLQRLVEAVEQAASARKHERSGDAFPAIARGGQSVWSLGVGGQAAKHIVQLDLVQPHIAALVGSGALGL